MEGYDKLALLISKYPELATVRKFARWSMRCLLYQQAEISWLESDLDILISMDANDQEKAKFCKDWKELADEKNDLDIINRREKIALMQQKIDTYHKSLLQTVEVFKLLSAPPSSVDTVREWLKRSEGGAHFLNTVEVTPWEPENADDLVGFLPASNADKFGQRLGDVFSPMYHAIIGSRRPPSGDPRLGDIWPYDKEKFTFAGNFVCMVLSFAIPTASIFALYYVHSMLARLLMVAAFILIFACAMMFAVGSRRGEVFAATAAFAAIQVVFVGGINISETGS